MNPPPSPASSLPATWADGSLVAAAFADRVELYRAPGFLRVTSGVHFVSLGRVNIENVCFLLAFPSSWWRFRSSLCRRFPLGLLIPLPGVPSLLAKGNGNGQADVRDVRLLGCLPCLMPLHPPLAAHEVCAWALPKMTPPPFLPRIACLCGLNGPWRSIIPEFGRAPRWLVRAAAVLAYSALIQESGLLMPPGIRLRMLVPLC